VAFSKRNLFATVAALAGAFASTQAGAFPALANSPNPDVTLVVWDTVANVTYFRDLGKTWSAATVGTAFASNLSFTHDSNWANFLTDLAPTGGVGSTTFYDVVSGTLAPTGTQILVSTGPAPLDAVNGVSLQTAISNWNSFAGDNAKTGSGTPNFNSGSPQGVTPNMPGSNISKGSDAGEASTAGWPDGFGQSDFVTEDNVGKAMGFYSMSGGTAGTKATVTPLPGVWLLNASGDLTYTVSAVPEPGHWMLFVPGLGIIGLVARRRLKTL
jgi:hypothetical protein